MQTLVSQIVKKRRNRTGLESSLTSNINLQRTNVYKVEILYTASLAVKLILKIIIWKLSEVMTDSRSVLPWPSNETFVEPYWN